LKYNFKNIFYIIKENISKNLLYFKIKNNKNNKQILKKLYKDGFVLGYFYKNIYIYIYLRYIRKKNIFTNSYISYYNFLNVKKKKFQKISNIK
jgi:hypothetical protein